MSLILGKLSPQVRSFFAKFPIKRVLSWLVACVFLFSLIIVIIDRGIAYYVKSDIYTDVNTIPYRPYGLILGTSKYTTKGHSNQFYDQRMRAAKNLFAADKIDYLLLSGDNRTLQYNEPRTMKRDLRRMGISEQFLFPDYAGFRTLDSIIRAKEVFQAEPMTIVTQRFHCERALFIAKYHHINAICFAADTPYLFSLTRVREALARILMLWELFIEKQPHFLGNPEPLPPPLDHSPTPETEPLLP